MICSHVEQPNEEEHDVEEEEEEEGDVTLV